MKFDLEEVRKMRTVMPNLIAHDIIGVSPMTGPTQSIYNMKNTQELLRLVFMLYDECISDNIDFKDFEEVLAQFINVYKKSTDEAQSEYHRLLAEKMKNDRRPS